MSGTTFNLYLGRGIFVPANATVMEAFRSATIQVKEAEPSTFEMTFQTSRNSSMNDYELILIPYLQVFNRVGISVDVGGCPIMLMDGLITSQSFTPGTGTQPDTVTVQGQDVSAAMNLIEKNMPWPCLADFEIVAAILLEYFVYGLVPITIPTVFSASQLPSEVTMQQTGTDLGMIHELCEKNGYIFKIIPGPLPGMNTAYFGPPSRLGYPCATLNCASLPDCNVESISFSYDGTSASLMGGMIMDVTVGPEPIPILSLPLILPPFSALQALLVNVPYVNFKLLKESRMDTLQSLAYATGQSYQASKDVVTAQGSVNSERYNSVIVSPGLINVRGAGLMYDGTYYVKSITHKISPKMHTQDFELTREGTMTLIPIVNF